VDGTPIDVIVDKFQRRYVISWRPFTGYEQGWGGDLIQKYVPFVPQMNITIEAGYDSNVGNGTYSYKIINGRRSEDSIDELLVDCAELNIKRVRIFDAIPSTDNKMRYPWGYVYRFLPGDHYLQNFRFMAFSDNGRKIDIDPGSSLDLLQVLEVPYKQLPGIVRCWSNAANYYHGLSVDQDPRNTYEILFTASIIVPTKETGPRKIPKFLYHGVTIGPVPYPSLDISRKEFLEVIIGYINEARKWGWMPIKTLAAKIEKQLAALRNGTFNESEISRIINEAETAFDRGEILAEAFILLKHNLSYLAIESNWMLRYP